MYSKRVLDLFENKGHRDVNMALAKEIYCDLAMLTQDEVLQYLSIAVLAGVPRGAIWREIKEYREEMEKNP